MGKTSTDIKHALFKMGYRVYKGCLLAPISEEPIKEYLKTGNDYSEKIYKLDRLEDPLYVGESLSRWIDRYLKENN